MLINRIERLKSLLTIFREFRNEESILIYQMGKVGSTSLENSLTQSLHFHTLYGNSPCWPHLAQRRDSLLKKFEGFVSDFTKRFAISLRKEIRIISIVREPVSRDMSMFFQDLPHWLYAYIGQSKVDTRQEGMDILMEAFHESYDWRYAINWYDKEIKRLTGIDIFESKFNKNEGIKELTKGKYKLLLVKVENLNQQIDIVSQFVGEEISLDNVNRGDSKWYAPVYLNFKKVFTLSEQYKKEVFSSKFYEYFYK